MADRFAPERWLVFIDDEDDGSEEEPEFVSDEEDDDYEPSGGESENGGDSDEKKRSRTEEDECASPEKSSDEKEWNLDEIDGLFCPICMEAWTSEGDHHICCLPCGHLYGLSCITRWLKQRKNQGKCPQCNRKCSLKDVRKLFASQIVAIDDKLQKKIRYLEAKCDSLQKMKASWKIKEVNLKKLKAEWESKCNELTKRTTYLESVVEDLSSGQSAIGAEIDLNSSEVLSSKFSLQEEFQVDGAHLFDFDTSENMLLFARSPPGMGAKDILCKVSLIHPLEREDILLPPSTSIIKDMHLSPSNDRLALLASLGKKLSLFSNSVVLTYDLPAASWSCSWDINDSHYVYAGLQNGSVYRFDKRQTSGPVTFLMGLTKTPVHTIHSLLNSDINREMVLSASSGGLSLWNFEGGDQRPTVLPGTDTQGVCISLAYNPNGEEIVASYRPRVEMTNDTPTISQLSGQGVLGCHVVYRRDSGESFPPLCSDYVLVDPIRLPKTAMIETDDSVLFAYRDEKSSDLNLQMLHGLLGFQRLGSNGRPLRDVKYTNAPGKGLLGCIHGETMQIFR